jgi:hypothetical protein
MMQPELKAKWVAALRSGKYVQAHGRLKDMLANEPAVSYCCLGVLCDIQGIDTNAVQGYSDTFNPMGIEGHTIEEGMLNKLVELNDYPPHHNFMEIADYIERNL